MSIFKSLKDRADGFRSRIGAASGGSVADREPHPSQQDRSEDVEPRFDDGGDGLKTRHDTT